jgi:uncharacterized NAD-dependent epimerase/dehydratase family protein
VPAGGEASAAGSLLHPGRLRHALVRGIDPAMAVLAHEGSKRYKEVFDLVHRREAGKPNEIWQADHTLASCMR